MIRVGPTDTCWDFWYCWDYIDTSFLYRPIITTSSKGRSPSSNFYGDSESSWHVKEQRKAMLEDLRLLSLLLSTYSSRTGGNSGQPGEPAGKRKSLRRWVSPQEFPGLRITLHNNNCKSKILQDKTFWIEKGRIITLLWHFYPISEISCLVDTTEKKKISPETTIRSVPNGRFSL